MAVKEFLDLLYDQVDKGVYVWGGNGENLLTMSDPVAWIRKKETSKENAERAIALFEQRLTLGVAPIQAFDCSGLVYWAQKQAGVGYGDKTANGWYKECDPVTNLLPGDLVFHHNGWKCTHVGVYAGGDAVIECECRDVGVVETSLKKKDKYWNRFGRLKKMEYNLLGDVNLDGKITAADAALILRYLDGLDKLDEQQMINADVNLDGKVTREDAEIILEYVVGKTTLPPATTIHMTGSLCLREEGRKDSKRIGYCHKGKDYPLLGRADTGWYKTQSGNKVGYISDKTKYTVLR